MKLKIFSIAFLSLFFIKLVAQESSSPIKWKASSIKIENNQYNIQLFATNPDGWELYAPGINFDGIHSADIILPDSSIKIIAPLKSNTTGTTIKSKIFEGSNFEVFNKDAEWTIGIAFTRSIPATIQLQLNYTYGKNDEFFPGESTTLEVQFEGGTASKSSLKIQNLDINHPIAECGSGDTNEKISRFIENFFTGFPGGLVCATNPLRVSDGSTHRFVFYQTWQQ